MANEYSSLANLKLQLGGVTSTADDALLNAALTAASRRIDGRCGRRFYLDTNATARTYPCDGRITRNFDGEGFIVDDIGSATGLVVEVGDGTTFTAITDYEQEPANALAVGKPVEILRRPLSYWRTSPRTRVRVTAKWGWPAIPDVIVEATLLLAARIYRRKDSPEGVIGNAEWGASPIRRLDPDVEDLIGDLARPGFG